MIRVAISVEGQTEEEFVNQVLARHLWTRRVVPTPILLGRGRGSFGGGNVSVDRLVPEIAHLIHNFDAVTSLVDFYGFRDKGSMNREELELHILQEVDRRIDSSLAQARVFPYVQQYEFEGLLFSDLNAFERAIQVLDVTPATIGRLRSIREQFQTPEDINDDRETAPSKRIQNLIPRYNKKDHGPLIAAETGLDIIRSECSLFDGWVARLESLGSPPESE